MSDIQYGREETKRRLQRNVITPGENSPSPEGPPESGEEIRAALRKKRRRRIRIAILVFAFAVAMYALYSWYSQSHRYSGWSTAWEKDVPSSEGGFAGYEPFGTNVIKYTKDGASYIDSHGNIIWSISYEMKSPVVSVSGDYAAIGDRQGNSIYICGLKGSEGQATTVLPILNVAVSSYGVVAAQVEDSTASYVTFYNKDGSALDVTIKTVMSQSGYIMDSALSPDGTQVMLSNVYVSEGQLGSRISFYNFSDYGMSYPDRLVGGFDELGTAISPSVKFLTDRRAVAFASGKVAFFSLENVTSPELITTVTLDDEMRAVAASDRYVAVVTADGSGTSDNRLHVYSPNGQELSSTGFDFAWDSMRIDGDMVILTNDTSCRIIGVNGKERFDATFDFPISIVRRGGGINRLLVTGGSSVKEVRMK